MRMRPEQKEAARAAIVAAAGRRFRLSGQAGVGIDALAGETGQTSGAIYAHFRSKAEVFAAVVEAGLGRLLSGIERTKAASGAWAAAFAAGYLSRGHRRGIAEGCLLPGLSADVARAPADVRETYGRSVDLALGLLADGCAGAGDRERREKAIAVLALSAGGILLSRAVPDGDLADQVLAACRKAAAEIAGAHAAP
jgi:TetR/AcrR family transcriptional repressor of nem operon